MIRRSSYPTVPREALAFFLLCVLAGGASSACAAEPPVASPDEVAGPETVAADAGVDDASIDDETAPSAERAARRDAFVSRLWWNQAKNISGLQLTEAQRRAMDERAKGFLAERLELVAEHREGMRAFGEALAAGDAKAARQATARAAGAQSTLQRAQMEMMVGVAEELSSEQRRRLAERSPGLFARLWVPSGPGRGAGSRSRRPERRPGGGEEAPARPGGGSGQG